MTRARSSAAAKPKAGAPKAGTAPKRKPAARPSRATRRAVDASQSARRRSLTGRAAVLGLVVCALVLTLAYPLRQFLSQRAEIDGLAARQRTQLERVERLEADARRYDDPAFVKAEARRRLQYRMPGETSYVVLDPSPSATPAAATERQVVDPVADDRPWYTRLWGTVEAADRPPAPKP